MAKIFITNSKVKTPTRSEKNVLTMYSPRSTYIERSDTLTIDTDLILHLPKDSTAHLVTKFQGQKIKTIVGPKTIRLWLTLLNDLILKSIKSNVETQLNILLLSQNT